MADDGGKGEFSSLKKAYTQLVNATHNICDTRYHYFVDTEADGLGIKLPNGLPDNFMILASVRTPSIPVDKISGAKAVKAQVIVEPLGQYCLDQSPLGLKAMAEWKSEFGNDCDGLAELLKGEVGDSFVCFPEFGFPYGYNDTKEGSDIGVVDEASWSDLKGKPSLRGSFVCLGSAHRRSTLRVSDIRDKQSGPRYSYTNTAFVYPESSEHSRGTLGPHAVMTAAQRLVPENIGGGPEELVITPNEDKGDGGIGALHVKIKNPANGEWVATSDINDLAKEKFSGLRKSESYQRAREAFEFVESTGIERPAEVRTIKKQSAAKKLKEYLDSHEKLRLDVFVTSRGVVAVLICFDAYDPAIFLNAVRLLKSHNELSRGSFAHPKIDLFLVPAFNRSGELKKLCKLLSQETESVVAYVSGDSKKGESLEERFKVYLSGYDYADVAQSSEWTVDSDGSLDTNSLVHPKDDHLRGYRLSKDLVAASIRYKQSFIPLPDIRLVAPNF